MKLYKITRLDTDDNALSIVHGTNIHKILAGDLGTENKIRVEIEVIEMKTLRDKPREMIKRVGDFFIG